MHKGRLEAFSDAVIAIIITIMVLELKIPHGTAITDLKPLVPVFFSYVLSFVFIGIYWNNHHHLLQASEKVNSRVLWANLHLLFWLSLIPFVTGWMGENTMSAWPVALYGVVLLFAGFAYYILSLCLIYYHGKDSVLAEALCGDYKERFSILVYLLGIGLSFVHPRIGYALYILIAIVWLIPDRRIAKELAKRQRL